MQVSTQVDANELRFNIRRVANDGRSLNGLNWDAMVLDESGQAEALLVRETGLGRFEATVPLAGRERLTVRLRDSDHDKMSIQHYHRPYPAEYRLDSTVPPALAALPSIAARSITAEISPHVIRRSVANYAYFAALGCMLMSIVLRRM